MKQIYHDTGYMAYDLTECKLNRLVDKDGKSHFIISYPKTWDAGEKQKLPTITGGEVEHRLYIVKEWEEVELDVKPYEGK